MVMWNGVSGEVSKPEAPAQGRGGVGELGCRR
ncbi:MAG: hypothetical protein JWS11_322 [Cypionkella sp.]|nr:hypothetical protein [Cypionkella sp.]